MKESNLDQEIREKLQGREIQPSESAWERLSSQLDEVQEEKKKGWFRYVGYAASIILLLSLFYFLNKDGQNTPTAPENKVVEETIETPQIDKTKDFTTPLPVENDAIVENTTPQTEKKFTKEPKPLQPKKVEQKKVPFVQPVETNSVIAKTDKTEIPEVDVQKTIKELNKDETVVATVEDPKASEKNTVINTQSFSNGISVDSDALLKSVTSTREELRAYYKKYKIDRQDVLLAIEKELKKSKLKIDPKTILAEVERDVNEESFQNNFYQFIKKRVSNVATAIANRNN